MEQEEESSEEEVSEMEEEQQAVVKKNAKKAKGFTDDNQEWLKPKQKQKGKQQLIDRKEER
ncbi:hypothetical protein DOY81_014672 [Sarcophaga bullata]|nr:hypothetical protein DOY81_014672 [Sarcophaga bullata]